MFCRCERKLRRRSGLGLAIDLDTGTRGPSRNSEPERKGERRSGIHAHADGTAERVVRFFGDVDRSVASGGVDFAGRIRGRDQAIIVREHP
jgi:hypothetical protein